jgi:NAD(P)-dependent dehydrogenase (short-subunit alcohol dehydrogenase family)
VAVLLTGSTSGLGAWLAPRLAAAGMTVLMHGRDEAKVRAGVAAVRASVGRTSGGAASSEPASGGRASDGRASDDPASGGRASGGWAEGFVADLSSLDECRRLAASVAARGDVDVLVNNAGIGFGSPGSGRELSRDGFELRWAVNYLAPVVITGGLLPTLRANAPATIVNVGSAGQVPIDFDDLQLERHYDGTVAYRRAKLALAAWTFQLADELRDSGVRVNCLHPATFMDTAMVRAAGVTSVSTVDDGGAATLRLILAPEGTGKFYNGLREAAAHPDAYDPAVRARLAEVTSAAIGQPAA